MLFSVSISTRCTGISLEVELIMLLGDLENAYIHIHYSFSQVHTMFS